MKTSQLLFRGAFGLGLCTFALTAPAQVAINTDGADPDASAMLDVTSNGKGVLIPRLTNAERDAITTPATGLMIYSTTDESFYYYDGAQWQPVGKAGDNDDTNELQQISLDSDADRIRLSNGGSALMTKYLDNTDAQGLSLDNDTLSLTNGGSVDLSPFKDNTDNQQLSLNTNILSLANGGSVNLAPFKDNTDAQQISLNNDILSLTNGGSVDLASYAGGGGSLTELKETLDTNGEWISGTGDAGRGIFLSDTGDVVYIGDLQSDVNHGPPELATLTLEQSLSLVNTDLVSTPNAGTVREVKLRIGKPDGADPGHYSADFLTDLESFRFGFGTLSASFEVPALVMDRDTGFALSLPATFNNNVKINTGNPGVGDVWTATSSSGDGEWASPATVFSSVGLRANNYYEDNNGTGDNFDDDGTRVDAGTSGYRELTEGTATATLSQGDTVLILVSFRVLVDGGSNDDRYAFQVRASGGISGQVTEATGPLDSPRQPRDSWQQISFHRVMTINSAPSNDIRFRLRVYMGNADDDLRIDDLNITVIEI